MCDPCIDKPTALKGKYFGILREKHDVRATYDETSLGCLYSGQSYGRALLSTSNNLDFSLQVNKNYTVWAVIMDSSSYSYCPYPRQLPLFLSLITLSHLSQAPCIHATESTGWIWFKVTTGTNFTGSHHGRGITEGGICQVSVTT